MAVRMWATLPKDYSANGLGAIEKALLDDRRLNELPPGLLGGTADGAHTPGGAT